MSTKTKPRIVRGVARRHAVKTMSDRVGCWMTDLRYAAFVVRWANVKPGMRVLDFGAGSGNLSLALIGAGAIVTAVEIDSFHEKKLRERIGTRGEVVIADFFDPHLRSRCRNLGGWDLALGNPEWEGDAEPRYLRRALELAPRAVGIISLDGVVSGARWEHWQWLRKHRQLLTPSRLSFSLDGGAGQEYPIAVEVTARSAPRRLDEVEVVAEQYYTPPTRAGR
jgi:SAM-dependent methyltransferase